MADKYVSSLASGGGDGSSGNPYTLAEMIAEINSAGAGGSAGVTYNIKADGAYTANSLSAITGSGTATAPCVIRGYATTPGDGYQGRSGVFGPLVDTNMPVINNTGGMFINGGAYILIEALKVVSTASATTFAPGSHQEIQHCIVEFHHVSTFSWPIQMLSDGAGIYNCDISGPGGLYGLVRFQQNLLRVIGCRIGGALGVGVDMAGHNLLQGCLIYGCGSHGIAMRGANPGSCHVIGNTIVDNAGSGIVYNATNRIQIAESNLITDNGAYGINITDAASQVIARHNRLDRNTSGAFTGTSNWLSEASLANDTTSILQAAEYVDAGSFDYRLKSSSPAIGAGARGTDIGALPRMESGGGRRPRGRYIGI